MSSVAPRGPECAHCGLRLGRRSIAGDIGGESLRFCCGGCLLAANVTRARGDPSVASALLVRVGLAAFFAMNVMMLTLPTYARHVYGDVAEGPLFVALRALAAVLTVPVLLLLGGPLVRSARQGLGRRQATADLLIVLAVGAAFALSVSNLAGGRPDTYFDTTVMLLVLVTIGRYLEATAKVRATEAMRARATAGPSLARRLGAAGIEEVAPEALRAGDVVEVGPGSAFPADGCVLEGEADVDEGMLTGEGRPQWKGVGSHVAGGTVSLDGRLLVRIERPAAESAQARIEEMLDAARAEPARIERTVDRLAAWLVPAVVAVSIAAGIGWWRVLGPDEGVLAAIAVLVVACPCGLVLATPVAISRGLSAAVRRGMVVRSAPVLEAAATVRAVVFDKTGTLTASDPRVEEIVVHAGTRDARDLLALAAAVERGIAHPLARAIVDESDRRGLDVPTARDVRTRPGRGAIGDVEGLPVAVGSAALLGEMGWPVAGGDRVMVATGDGAVAGIRLREEVSPRATAAIAELRRGGYEVRLASGDTECADGVRALFREGEVATGLSPAAKLAAVRALREREGHPVAMVGDGVNDAPALAAADVGIAVASATDLARLSADVAILGGGAASVPELLAHARRVRRILRQNLFWALAYNSVAVGLAAAARLDPLIAAVAMIGSSILVLGNSSRIAYPAEGETSTLRVEEGGTGIASLVRLDAVD